METIVPIIILVIVVIIIALIAVMGRYFGLWLRAVVSDAHVGFTSLIGMSLRKVDPNVIVNARIMAVKAGLLISAGDLEMHYLAQGNVVQVVQALIAANEANIPLTFACATAIDLAGRDVLDAVRKSVNPKVIDVPDPSKGDGTFDAVAVDGVHLKVKARVSVRANLERLVGGADEETIIARVGGGIITAIGSADTREEVLENPDMISRQVLAKGLDAGTAFEILSIDLVVREIEVTV